MRQQVKIVAKSVDAVRLRVDFKIKQLLLIVAEAGQTCYGGFPQDID